MAIILISFELRLRRSCATKCRSAPEETRHAAHTWSQKTLTIIHSLGMARTLAVLALALAGAHAATELTESNFDAEVFDSGKNAFGA